MGGRARKLRPRSGRRTSSVRVRRGCEAEKWSKRRSPGQLAKLAKGRSRCQGLGVEAEVEPYRSRSKPASVGDFLELMKPRVMSLVVFTALTGMVAAPGGIHPVLGIIALIAIAVGAGASGALNMWYDADIDARMARTAARPIPRGRVTRDEALTFGTVLSVVSVLTLGVLVNWVAGALLALTIALLRLHLHDVAEAADAAEHRHRRRRRRLPADDRLGRGDGLRQPRERAAVPHHLHVDAAALLGAGALSLPRLRARRRADAAGRRRAARRRGGRSCSTRCCWCRWP